MSKYTVEEVKQKRKESRARWIAANPQVNKVSKAAYVKKNKILILAKARIKSAALRTEKIPLTDAILAERIALRLLKKRVAQKKYRLDNPEKIVDTSRRTYAKNRLARDAEKAAWARKNSGRVSAWARQRQLSKIQRTPAWLTVDEHWMIEQAYELAILRSKMFGFPWHVDHVLPLRGKTVSGLHTPYNLQVILGSENCRKGNRVAVA